MSADPHAARFLPQVGHWTPNLGINADGSLFATFHLSGLPAELAGAQAVRSAQLGDNMLACGLSDPRIEWWDHDVRQDGQRMAPLPTIDNWFAARFDDAYRAAQDRAVLYRNDLFATVVFHPADGFKRGASALFGGGRKGPLRAEDPMVRDFEDILQRMEAGLHRYGVRRLGLREHKGVVFSELAEALHLVANGHYRPLGLTSGRLGSLITPERILFEDWHWQVLGSGPDQFGAMVSFKHYPASTSAMMLSGLRSAPFPVTITNSCRFRRKTDALGALALRIKQMQSGGDTAKTQIAELALDEDDIQSGRSVQVSHHCSVAVRASSLLDLDRRVASVQTMLSDCGITGIRETDAIKASYYAQLPGNRRWRPRPGNVKSINATAFAAKHGVPRGSPRSRWGAPIITLRTTSDTAYDFHFHVQGSEQSPAEDVGSFMLIGGSGVGKTGLLGTVALQALRVPEARVVVIDKGFGLSVMVRAAGGAYLPITDGEPTGFAPLRAYPNTAENVAHLVRLLRGAILSDGRGDITSDEDAQLQRGVERQMAMPLERRGVAGIGAMLGQRERDGAAARLAKWCRGERLGWVLDNEVDQVDLSTRICGIDPSALYGDPITAAPLMADFLFRVRKLIDGRPFVLVIDEAEQIDKLGVFADDVHAHLREIRKKEGIVGLATQNVSFILNGPQAENYRKQIPTKFFFADDTAKREDLVERAGFTEAEYLAVTQVLPNLRHTFLLKRPSGSVLCRFDLSGALEKVAVISARTATYALMNRLIARHGADPAAWVPHFERLAPSLAAEPTATLITAAQEEAA